MEDRRKYQQDKKEEFANKFLENKEIPRYANYQVVSKVRSIKRAIRRGRVDLYTGIPFPKRPFNNRKVTTGRKVNELKKQIYEQYRQGTI